MVKTCLACAEAAAGEGRSSRSSTCARSRRSTWPRCSSRSAGPAASSSSTRRTSTSASARRSPPGSPRSASTRSRRRCSGWAASTPPTRRPGRGGVPARPRPGARRRRPLAGVLSHGEAVNEFKLPDVGEGLTEAEIVTWQVKVGDVIKVNDVVVEIETAKSLVELPSPYAGTVHALLVPEGETVAGRDPDHRGRRRPVRRPRPAPRRRAGEPAPARSTCPTRPPPGGGENPTLVGYGPARRRRAAPGPRGCRRRRPPTPVPPPSSSCRARFGQAVTERADVDEPGRGGRARGPATPLPAPGAPRPWAAVGAVLAKPPVRKLAQDLGVDLRSADARPARTASSRARTSRPRLRRRRIAGAPDDADRRRGRLPSRWRPRTARSGASRSRASAR